jgi:exosome complex exonuclease DIS3/RRP44
MASFLTNENENSTREKFAFYKRTRRGKVIRLIREKYYRSDVDYGYLCGNLLSLEHFKQIVASAPHKQLLILDTNVALHQIDILEYKCPATSLVVVLQTVLQELKHINLSVFRRLTSLLKDESRLYIFYPNEVSNDTSLLRRPMETVNDFNDRYVRQTTKYYDSVLKDIGESIMITNDRKNQVFTY